MKSVSVIIPTTGKSTLHQAIRSCLEQTFENYKIIVVCDGPEFFEDSSRIIKRFSTHSYKHKLYFLCLPENTGANGQNGHRIYAAMSFLANSDYICYLDEDCFYESNHIESCMETIQKYNLQWCYSLRNIVNIEGSFVCPDDCESLGKFKPVFDYHLCDTSTFFIETNLSRYFGSNFVGEWGHDRRYFEALSNPVFNLKFGCTGEYTLNYRVGGNPNSPKPEFFQRFNELVYNKYGQDLPWRK